MPSAIRGWVLLSFVAFPSVPIAHTIIFAFIRICVPLLSRPFLILQQKYRMAKTVTHITLTLSLPCFIRLCLCIVSVVGGSRHRRDNVASTAMQLTNERTVCLACFFHVFAYIYTYICIRSCWPVCRAFYVYLFLLVFLACAQCTHKQL